MKISNPDLKLISKRIAIVLICMSAGWYLKGRLKQ